MHPYTSHSARSAPAGAHRPRAGGRRGNPHGSSYLGHARFRVPAAAHATKGSGLRELGDRLLLAGHRSAIIQVKARTITPKSQALEIAWIQKVAANAMSQAKGTVRQLRTLPADMLNGRNRTLRVDGNAFEWIAVFLLDHPHVPQDTVVTWQPLGIPAIALTRRGWDFLFDQLRSTTAVLDYLLGTGGTLFAAPQLPQAPAAVTAPTSIVFIASCLRTSLSLRSASR